MRPDLKVEKNKLILIKKLEKEDTYKVTEQKGIFTLNVFKKPQWTKGITSYCGDGQHIYMFDYDGICRWIVEKELEEVSKSLWCPVYLFKTKEEIKNLELVGNYHGICLAKAPAYRVVNHQREYTSCDLNYVTMPLRSIYRSWCLRLSDKKGSNEPEFDKVIGETKKVTVEISEAHLRLLNLLYKLPKIRYLKKDGLKKLYFNTYETGI